MKLEGILLLLMLAFGPALITTPLTFYLTWTAFSFWRRKHNRSYLFAWRFLAFAIFALGALVLWSLFTGGGGGRGGGGGSGLEILLVLPIVGAVLGSVVGFVVALFWTKPPKAVPLTAGPLFADDLLRQRVLILLGLAAGIGLLGWFVASGLR